MLDGAATQMNAALSNERTLLDFALAAEPENLCLGLPGHLDAGGIIGVEDGKVVRPLVLEEAGLSIRISFKGAMAVEVIGSDVQHHGNLRAKLANGLQLKARNFKDGYRVCSCA